MSTWQQRVRRARFLSDSFPASRQILSFYSHVADWQGTVAPRLSSFKHIPDVFPGLLDLVGRLGSPHLREIAGHIDIKVVPELLREYWNSSPVAPDFEFFARVALQPYAVNVPDGMDCPWCLKPPQAGCLRPQGDGLAFELVCGLCLRRRDFPRGKCPGCEESSESKIASYTAPDFPHMRLLACETCKRYLHVVDLSKDIAAIPEVDEIAGLPLDIWAQENGYQKLLLNIVGV